MDSTETYEYEGSELELFARATLWKTYVRSRMDPYIGRHVLEVGAGLGGMTRVLDPLHAYRWVCLEPDPTLAERLSRAISAGELPAICRVVVGTLDDLANEPPFDTLLYMDVLEHIEDDRAEVARAARRIRPGGHLIVLSPAHQWLYTPFDEAIGHYRRYSRRSPREAIDGVENLEPVKISYLDSVGMLASIGNRFVLRKSMPNALQISLWDKVMVRLSRWVDPLIRYNLGKSVLGVWRKCDDGGPSPS